MSRFALQQLKPAFATNSSFVVKMKYESKSHFADKQFSSSYIPIMLDFELGIKMCYPISEEVIFISIAIQLSEQ